MKVKMNHKFLNVKLFFQQLLKTLNQIKHGQKLKLFNVFILIVNIIKLINQRGN
jgi:hypothetical protein